MTGSARLLTGLLLGALVGLGVGYLAFSDASSTHEPSALHERERVAAAAESGRADLASPPTARAAEPPRSAPAREVGERADAAPRTQSGPRESGAFTILGSVTDRGGAGLADVLVRCERIAEPAVLLAPTELGRGEPADEREESGARTTTRTDAHGAFRFEGLADGRYRVDAYARGWWLRPVGLGGAVLAGTRADFTGRRVVPLEVRVLMPDGSEAAEAAVFCTNTEDEAWSPGPFAWSPEEPVVHVIAGELELRAAARPLGGAAPTEPRDAELVSPERSVRVAESGENPTVELVLGTQPGIRGRVSAETGEDPSGFVVAIARANPGEVVEPTSLERSRRKQRVDGYSRYAFRDVVPGRYAVGLLRTWSGKVAVHTVVEVSDAFVTCDLHLPPTPREECLTAEVLDPRGVGLERCRFSLVRDLESSSTTRGLAVLEARDGRYLLDLPGSADREYDESGEERGVYSLVVEQELYGETRVVLAPSQRDAVVRFPEPAVLSVELRGADPAGAHDDLVVELLVEDGDDWESVRLRHLGALDPGEPCVFEKLAPGPHRLHLLRQVGQAGGWTRYLVLRRDLELAPGSNATRLEVPVLHGLDVVVFGGDGARVRVVRESAAGDELLANRGATCDASGRAHLEGLPAGTYTLSARLGERTHETRITIPTGVVELDPATW